MTIIDTLITDRTQVDKSRAEQLATKGWARMTTSEREEWMAGPKGAYNAADLNRVGEALLYLMDRLNSYGYVVTVTPRTDWTIDEIPAPTDLKHYLDDVATIRTVMELPPTTPNVPPNMDGLTIQKANDIERILLDVDQMLSNIAAAWFYSGEIYAGEFT